MTRKQWGIERKYRFGTNFYDLVDSPEKLIEDMREDHFYGGVVYGSDTPDGELLAIYVNCKAEELAMVEESLTFAEVDEVERLLKKWIANCKKLGVTPRCNRFGR